MSENRTFDLTQTPPVEEPARQYYYMEKLRGLVADQSRDHGPSADAAVVTFGCQMNARDSEKLRGILREAGYQEGSEEDADFVIYNTCTVRENANNKVYGRLGQAQSRKRNHPWMKIALCGCMMQEPEEVEKIKKSYACEPCLRNPQYLQVRGAADPHLRREDGGGCLEGDGPDCGESSGGAEVRFQVRREYHVWLQQFCSYCIVPYVRGRERSRPPEEIIAEIRKLAQDGVTEVMLLGQNVNSYGRGLPRETPSPSCCAGGDGAGNPKDPFYDQSSEGSFGGAHRDHGCLRQDLPASAPSSAVGKQPDLKRMNRKYDKEQYLR